MQTNKKNMRAKKYETWIFHKISSPAPFLLATALSPLQDTTVLGCFVKCERWQKWYSKAALGYYRLLLTVFNVNREFLTYCEQDTS